MVSDEVAVATVWICSGPGKFLETTGEQSRGFNWASISLMSRSLGMSLPQGCGWACRWLESWLFPSSGLALGWMEQNHGCRYTAKRNLQVHLTCTIVPCKIYVKYCKVKCTCQLSLETLWNSWSKHVQNLFSKFMSYGNMTGDWPQQRFADQVDPLCFQGALCPRGKKPPGRSEGARDRLQPNLNVIYRTLL